MPFCQGKGRVAGKNIPTGRIEVRNVYCGSGWCSLLGKNYFAEIQLGKQRKERHLQVTPRKDLYGKFNSLFIENL
jgi:hypothetical protein